jgi:hypothetical protein
MRLDTLLPVPKYPSEGCRHRQECVQFHDIPYKVFRDIPYTPA